MTTKYLHTTDWADRAQNENMLPNSLFLRNDGKYAIHTWTETGRDLVRLLCGLRTVAWSAKLTIQHLDHSRLARNPFNYYWSTRLCAALSLHNGDDNYVIDDDVHRWNIRSPVRNRGTMETRWCLFSLRVCLVRGMVLEPYRHCHAWHDVVCVLAGYESMHWSFINFNQMNLISGIRWHFSDQFFWFSSICGVAIGFFHFISNAYSMIHRMMIDFCSV